MRSCGKRKRMPRQTSPDPDILIDGVGDELLSPTTTPLDVEGIVRETIATTDWGRFHRVPP